MISPTFGKITQSMDQEKNTQDNHMKENHMKKSPHTVMATGTMQASP